MVDNLKEIYRYGKIIVYENNDKELTEDDKQSIKYNDAIVKINNLKIRLAEYDAEINNSENSEEIEGLKEKNKKLERTIKKLKK